MRAIAPLLLTITLAGCGTKVEQPQTLDGLDNELTAATGANATDPAITVALRDQIMVDPQLAQQSNANAIRPPPRPDSDAVPPDTPLPDPVQAASLRHAPAAKGDCPECRTRSGALTLGALAGRTTRCGAVAYSAGWANRLPADLPLYPDARVQEAAGTDAAACALRVVSFASAAPAAKLIDWYYTRATAAGYSAEHRADGRLDVLGGTRGGAAYIVYVGARAGGGADVDLVTNAGR